MTPLSHDRPLSPPTDHTPSQYKTQSPPPINPASLNLSPAVIPAPSPTTQIPSPAPLVTSDPNMPLHTVPAITPTVAETGVPVSAGADGPGPASGSLHDIKAASSTAGPRSGGHPGNEPQSATFGQSDPPAFGAGAAAIGTGSAPHYPTAEEEKRRLAAYSQVQAPPQASQADAIPPSQPTVPTTSPHYETADDEKKRLEREERERLLQGGGAQGSGQNPPAKKEDDLPPYQDY